MFRFKLYGIIISFVLSLLCNIIVACYIFTSDCDIKHANTTNYIIKDTAPNPEWSYWKEGTMFAFGFPDKSIPSVYKMAGRGALYNDGMYVAQCGKNTRWNQQNFPHGGHVFEGWDTDRKSRITLLVLERNDEKIAQNGDFEPDGLSRAAIQTFDYTTRRFGWLKVGSDSKYDYMGGWDFTDSWVKAHTPVTFRPQQCPTNMPGNDGKQPPIHDGTFYVDLDGTPRIFSKGKWKKIVLED